MPTFQFEFEYAKSGRAACKQCKEKIAQGAIRIGLKALTDSEGAEDAADRQRAHTLEATKWYHSSCFQSFRGTAWFKKNLPENASECGGFEELNTNDQPQVQAIFKACRGEGPAPALTPDIPKAEASTPETKGKKRTAATKAEDGSSTKAAKKASKAPAVEANPPSQEDLDAIEAAKAEFSKKSIAALGMLLAKNGLPKSGKKEEILERAAEAKALGVPPECPTCTKAKLRWSKVTGTFSCPGFFDDEAKHFKKCKGPAAAGPDVSLVRTPWQELTA